MKRGSPNINVGGEIMLYELNEEQNAFHLKVREVFEKEVRPLVGDYEEREECPVGVFRILGREPLLCLRCPREYGGPGLNKVYECIVVGELSRVSVGIGAGVMVHGGLAIDPILKFGSEALKQTYLIPATQGEKIGAFALTEPEAGSDVTQAATTAVRKKDEYVINSTKIFITNGDKADFLVVFCQTNPENTNKYNRHSFIIVETNRNGFEANKLRGKLGIRASDTAEVSFSDVRVHISNLIGKEGDGFKELMMYFNPTRLIVCADGIFLNSSTKTEVVIC